MRAVKSNRLREVISAFLVIVVIASVFVWRFHVENPPSHIEITKHKRQPNCRKVAQYNRDKKYSYVVSSECYK